MSSQDSFLSIVRKNIGVDQHTVRSLQDHPDLQVAGLGQPHMETDSNDNDLLAILSESCKLHNMALHLVQTEQDAAALAVELIHQTAPEFSDKKQVMVHDHPLLKRLNLPGRLENSEVSIDICKTGDPDTRKKHSLSCTGITAPSCIVASHGTIIQQSGKGQPRATSLLPSGHIAIAAADKVVMSLSEGFKALKDYSSSNTVMISGPSKTADIEAQLVFGAHGPRRVDLIIIKESDAF